MPDTFPLRPHPLRGRRGVAAAAAAVLACGAAVTAGAPAHAADIPAGNTQLHGVSADSATDAWAVGYATTAAGSVRSLALHWNGTKWAPVASPSPTNSTELNGVSALSPTDAWAVGYDLAPINVEQTVTLRWNGTKWIRVASPNPGTSTNVHEDELAAVSAVSASNAWAVGQYTNSSNQAVDLILHWNGTKWVKATIPNPTTSGNSFLSGVTALSATDAWAVGAYTESGTSLQTFALHWDGSSWTQVDTPDPGGITGNNFLNAVSGDSPTDVWSSGTYYGNNGGETLMLHWDGTSWTKVKTVNPGTDSNEFNGVAAISPTDVWGGGVVQSPNNQTLAENWNGTSFARTPAPIPGKLTGQTVVEDVSATSPTDVWAAGYFYTTPPNPYQTLLLHWNGTSWTKVFSPN